MTDPRMTPLAEIVRRHRPDREPLVASPTALSRRRALATGATTATALGLAAVGARRLAGARDAAPSLSPASGIAGTTTECATLTPEFTAGPFYVDEALVRRDITDDREGLPLALTINVVDTAACAPLADAAIEIWHCDARGYYSGVSGNSPGSDASAEEIAAAAESMSLRGVQITDAVGAVTFDTIYPGWYRGRTIHIHLQVMVAGEIDAEKTYENGTTVHTGQLFFDDAISDDVFLTDAYANRPEDERTLNDEDGILGDHDDDPPFLVALVQVDPEDIAAGFTGIVTIGVDPGAR